MNDFAHTFQRQCKKCESPSLAFQIVFFKNPAYKTTKDPKWAFHIKRTCVDCGAFNGFEKQEPELMQYLSNMALMDFLPTDRDT